jgi:hypothetical protein
MRESGFRVAAADSEGRKSEEAARIQRPSARSEKEEWAVKETGSGEMLLQQCGFLSTPLTPRPVALGSSSGFPVVPVVVPQ